MGKKSSGAVVDDRYFELVRKFPLKSLQSEEELDRAIAVVNQLVDRGFENLSPGEEAYLDVLSDLVEKYEDEHHPIPEASPTGMIQFFMEDRQLSQRAVALGSGIAVSTMSEILAGRRQMNLEHMRKLATFFQVSVSLFLPGTKAPHSHYATSEEFAKAKRRVPSEHRKLNERLAKR